MQLLTTSNFTGTWYHAALLFSGLRYIVERMAADGTAGHTMANNSNILFAIASAWIFLSAFTETPFSVPETI